jgi:hypothetical protein
MFTEHTERLASLVWSGRKIDVCPWTSSYEDAADTSYFSQISK